MTCTLPTMYSFRSAGFSNKVTTFVGRKKDFFSIYKRTNKPWFLSVLKCHPSRIIWRHSDTVRCNDIPQFNNPDRVPGNAERQQRPALLIRQGDTKCSEMIARCDLMFAHVFSGCDSYVDNLWSGEEIHFPVLCKRMVDQYTIEFTGRNAVMTFFNETQYDSLILLCYKKDIMALEESPNNPILKVIVTIINGLYVAEGKPGRQVKTTFSGLLLTTVNMTESVKIVKECHCPKRRSSALLLKRPVFPVNSESSLETTRLPKRSYNPV